MPESIQKDGYGVNLLTVKVTPLQAAFLSWCRQHPYATIMSLEIHEGVPYQATVANGLGVDKIRFEKVAKEEGLLP